MFERGGPWAGSTIELVATSLLLLQLACQGKVRHAESVLSGTGAGTGRGGSPDDGSNFDWLPHAGGN